jgi:putative transcriptional regulator
MLFNKNEQGNLTKKQKKTLSNLIRELRGRTVNNNLFKEMISGFVEAKKYRAGEKTQMRVSCVAFEPVSMKPAEIRRVRTRLRFSQPEFAEFLCTRVGTLRSWEQGSRKPQSSALRLAIAKEKPAILLKRRG